MDAILGCEDPAFWVLSGFAVYLAAVLALAHWIAPVQPKLAHFARELPVIALTVVAAAVPPFIATPPVDHPWLVALYVTAVIVLGAILRYRGCNISDT